MNLARPLIIRARRVGRAFSFLLVVLALLGHILPAAAQPAIDRVSPNPAPALDARQDFMIYGRNFQQGANVILRDLRTGEVFTNRPIASLTSTSIMITPWFTSNAAEWSVEVINPDGRPSGQYRFQVGLQQPPPPQSDPPVITGVSPDPAPALDARQDFTVTGRNFQQGANIILRDLDSGESFTHRTSTSFSNTQIVLTPWFTATPAQWSVEVINPDGQSTGQRVFTTIAIAPPPLPPAPSPPTEPSLPAPPSPPVADPPQSVPPNDSNPPQSEPILLDRYPIVGQHESASYASWDFATSSDHLYGKIFQVRQLACAAAVYVMLDRGRAGGNPESVIETFYEIGPGARLPPWMGPRQSLSIPRIVESLRSGFPILIRGKRGNRPHFMLIVGCDSGTEVFYANDPLDAKRVRLEAFDGDSLRTTESSWLDSYDFDEMGLMNDSASTAGQRNAGAAPEHPRSIDASSSRGRGTTPNSDGSAIVDPAPIATVIDHIWPANPTVSSESQGFILYGTDFDDGTRVRFRHENGRRAIAEYRTHAEGKIVLNIRFRIPGTWIAEVVRDGRVASEPFRFQVAPANEEEPERQEASDGRQRREARPDEKHR